MGQYWVTPPKTEVEKVKIPKKQTLIDRLIRWAYHTTTVFKLPLYLRISRYKLCVYAMNMDLESLRIKIERDGRVWKVLKEGVY